MQTPFEKLYEMRFHEAAVWGAITFVRHFNPQVTLKDVLTTFREYFGMDENSFPIDSAMVNFYRTNEKISVLVRRKKLSAGEEKEIMVQNIQCIKQMLDEFLEKNSTHVGK